ncbi:putative branched-subunit amino acid permease [Candidatus Pelagibacter ubique]|uniref:Branched-subunit amino acid permease n=1 Tax=Pelagibacter ubique TaxID=198252 RepID=A0ABX1T0M8_PELUQ|nr:AzlC family ABC transporter permease [Candidatus Pelagibacter ubique]NMN67646.1 putative branched-subunit amino acid permease [Candidatus Pelagibacter ubique]
MININYFLKGFFCIKSANSPAIALFASFVAVGALFKSIGLNIQESILSTSLTYALPGSLIMAESLIVGASLLNIFLAVWLVNARLYPMTVSLFPLLTHKSQPRLKYYLACHFIAVSAWLIMKENYKSVDRKYRLDYWIGVGAANLSVAVLATVFGFLIADYLSKDMMIGLAIVNPVYFICVMVAAMKTIQMSLAVILGSVFGILFYFVSPEWCILFGGFTAGSLAFFIGELY